MKGLILHVCRKIAHILNQTNRSFLVCRTLSQSEHKANVNLFAMFAWSRVDWWRWIVLPRCVFSLQIECLMGCDFVGYLLQVWPYPEATYIGARNDNKFDLIFHVSLVNGNYDFKHLSDSLMSFSSCEMWNVFEIMCTFIISTRREKESMKEGFFDERASAVAAASSSVVVVVVFVVLVDLGQTCKEPWTRSVLGNLGMMGKCAIVSCCMVAGYLCVCAITTRDTFDELSIQIQFAIHPMLLNSWFQRASFMLCWCWSWSESIVISLHHIFHLCIQRKHVILVLLLQHHPIQQRYSFLTIKWGWDSITGATFATFCCGLNDDCGI